ncbi:hypothetical protein AVEN_173346-1 [Araneus ventricosus]|uniref:Uncharacterized protein n=1 Tax=Araneus ventricosus TaxID=182803 RepID=A0A4Y2IB32_ARAVE|nr:hypothetical protein AVEN_173346-1 [Araneus ventricosus]
MKRRVSLKVKDHFLDEWGNLVDPSELAGKLYEYEFVRSACLYNGIYLLGNRSAQLIEEQRKTPNLNAVVTRAQKLKKETDASVVIKPPPQGQIEGENPSIIVEELAPLLLPQAEGDTTSLLKVNSETFASDQRNCTSLKPCCEQERDKQFELKRQGRDRQFEFEIRKMHKQFELDKIKSHTSLRKDKGVSGRATLETRHSSEALGKKITENAFFMTVMLIQNNLYQKNKVTKKRVKALERRKLLYNVSKRGWLFEDGMSLG